jgi:hypothetical protein
MSAVQVKGKNDKSQRQLSWSLGIFPPLWTPNGVGKRENIGWPCRRQRLHAGTC